VKKTIIALALALAAAGAFAQHGMGKGIDPALIIEAAPGAAGKTEGELTIGEKVAIASALSVAMQEKAYVRMAGIASFILPGAGQIKTGDYLLGAVHLGAQAAIVGGTAAALYYLAPPELLDFSGTREERHAAMSAYMTRERIGEIFPSLGILAGGTLLSFINSEIASHGARAKAQANVDSGKVKFEPNVTMAQGFPGIGMKLRFK
jgi:hypothetical protein